MALGVWPVGVGIAVVAWSCASDDAASAGKPDASVSLTPCKTDTECPAGQACETSSGSDSYCAPLCSAPADCPKGYDCPGLVLGAPGACAEVGAHAGGKGVCDQFAGNNGPNSCITGSGDAGTQDGGGQQDCQGMCKQASPPCTGVPPLDTCLAQCELTQEMWGELCPSQLQAHSDCIKSAKFSCAPDGTLVYGGECDGLENEVWKCVGCYVAPNEPPCTACLRTSCCKQMTDANNAPNIVEWKHCRMACPTSGCAAQCDGQYPEAAAANEAYMQCGTTTCGSSC